MTYAYVVFMSHANPFVRSYQPAFIIGTANMEVSKPRSTWRLFGVIFFCDVNGLIVKLDAYLLHVAFNR